MSEQIRYVAIGDSFTEGVGDILPGGSFRGDLVRGWADRAAEGLATVTGEPILYANLAVRGKLLKPIIDEQLDHALSLKPTIISLNGGGNDMLRPGTDLEWVTKVTVDALQRITDAGVKPLLLSGANPTNFIPGGKKVREKGEALTASIGAFAASQNIQFVNNWADKVLWSRQYWDEDRLHLGPVGHTRVASNVLQTLGFEVPADWQIYAEPQPKPGAKSNSRYVYKHVLPWIGRRLTGRSSGDGRAGKHLDWVEVQPVAPH